MPNPLFEEYWQLRMESAVKRLEAARRVIRDHKPSRGAIAENTLRALLSEFLPVRCAVSTGFILTKEGNASRQVDILVYDQTLSAPIYRDGAMVILPPSVVELALEVKSYLDGNAIDEAFENIASVKRLNPNIRGLIFAYDGIARGHVFRRHLMRHCRRVSRTKTARLFESRWRQLPDQIYHFEKSRLVQKMMPADSQRLFSAYKTTEPLIRYLLDEVMASCKVVHLKDYLAAAKLEQPEFNA